MMAELQSFVDDSSNALGTIQILRKYLYSTKPNLTIYLIFLQKLGGHSSEIRDVTLGPGTTYIKYGF